MGIIVSIYYIFILHIFFFHQAQYAKYKISMWLYFIEIFSQKYGIDLIKMFFLKLYHFEIQINLQVGLKIKMLLG